MKVLRLLRCALFLSSNVAFTSTTFAADNCKSVVDALNAQFPAPQNVVVTGFCTWAKPELADHWANTIDCPTVFWTQGAFPFAKGHRTVANWVDDAPIFHWDSYLDYCVGYKGPAPSPDPAKAEAFKKQFEELRARLKQ